MAVMMEISIWLSGLNIVLVLALLYVYAQNLAKMKSGFTLGLATFAVLFLLQNIVTFYYSVTMMPLYAQGLELYNLMFTLLQSVAFIILNWITWK